MTLAEHWYSEVFEPNSPEDHALAILDAEFHFAARLRQAGRQEDTTVPETNCSVDPWSIAQHAYEIGRRFDALQKKPVEVMAIAKKTQVERNQLNGMKGVQRVKAVERKAVLSRLAQASKAFEYTSDKQAVRLAKGLTRNHDEGSDLMLFTINGKLLSDRWFSEWWDGFRAEKNKINSSQ